jgi:hypothetical protein
VLELAKTTPEEAVRNSDTLQYFALEAYAYDIALPGEACAGKWTATSSEVASSTAGGSATPDVTPSATPTDAPSTTSAAAQECHTHADGTEHCT